MRVEGWLVAVTIVAALGLAVARVALVPEAPGRMAVPTAGELAPLERYLTPVAVDGTPGVVPPRVVIEGSPFRSAGVVAEPGPPRPATGPAPAPRWAVTAILIAGDRPVAIVNDRLVRPGDTLEDGARIAAVERDHVVLITPGGERRRLELGR